MEPVTNHQCCKAGQLCSLQYGCFTNTTNTPPGYFKDLQVAPVCQGKQQTTTGTVTTGSATTEVIVATTGSSSTSSSTSPSTTTSSTGGSTTTSVATTGATAGVSTSTTTSGNIPIIRKIVVENRGNLFKVVSTAM